MYWYTSQETEMYFAEFKRSCLRFWAFLYVSLLRFVEIVNVIILI